MLLVFLFLLMPFLIYLLQIRVNINFSISNENKNIESNYIIKVGLYIMKKIKIFDFSLDKEKVNKKNIVKRAKDIFEQERKNLGQYDGEEVIKNLKYLNYDVDKFNANLKIGTENAIITSFLTAIISSIIGMFIANFIKKYNPEKHYFVVNPIYNDELVLDGSFTCTIYLNVVHFIYTLLKTKYSKKYEHTDAQRAYENN